MVCKSNIILLSVHPSVHPSCFLLNHWAEFNQTCYIMTSTVVRVCQCSILFTSLFSVVEVCYFIFGLVRDAHPKICSEQDSLPQLWPWGQVKKVKCFIWCTWAISGEPSYQATGLDYIKLPLYFFSQMQLVTVKHQDILFTQVFHHTKINCWQFLSEKSMLM